MPEISVIIPVYKVEKYLKRCVDSVLNQTFKDLEIILVDDGSPDSCPALCDEYVKNNKNCSVLHIENGGLSNARNTGLAKAKGKYVAFVDSDDWVSSDAYEYLYNLITKYNADVASCDYVTLSQDTYNFSQSKINETVLEGTNAILEFYLAQDKLHRNNDYTVCTKLYKKTLFENIQFPKGQLYEDIITNLLLLQNAERYVKSDKIIYAYYQGNVSITRSLLQKKHLDLILTSKRISTLIGNKSLELEKLCKRKVAMSYFSILTKYIRFGTDMSDEEIKTLVQEYKAIKNDFLKTEKSFVIHLLSFMICSNIKLCRNLFAFIH